jgi:SAM-dependent methyltransferase
MSESDAALLEAAHRMSQDPTFREVIWRHCGIAGAKSDLARFSSRIHPNDQMLQHSLRHFRDINWSLSQYFHVALQQHYAARQVLDLYFGACRDNLEILDFACGYGRLLRFLVLGESPSRIWGSEIQHDAVDYVVREFGVHGIHSDVDPQRFQPGRQFDCIWVASLFSHLPERLFHAWLERLLAVLKPGGVLCFSVHDQCLLPPPATMPPSGIHFIPSSENDDLDKQSYGTTFVSESFVRNAIAAACGPGHPFHRLRRGLANEQDIYVVPKDRDPDLGRLAAFRQGPWGWVDSCDISDGGELYMHGWAASFDDVRVESVKVTLDGRTHDCRTGLPREDVARVLGDERLGTTGWEFRLQLPARQCESYIEVSACSAAGELALLYTGKLAIPPRKQTGPVAASSVAGKVSQSITALFAKLFR